MNFELSDEQEALREAARGALSRHETLAAARAAADGGERLDLWDVAREMGWPGLLGCGPISVQLLPLSQLPPNGSRQCSEGV